jgi:hypothetical protein
MYIMTGVGNVFYKLWLISTMMIRVDRIKRQMFLIILRICSASGEN